MRELTREKFNKLQQAMMKTYGVSSTRNAFAVSEPIETRLNSAIQDASDFLQRITMLPVTDRKGQAVKIGIYSPLSQTHPTHHVLGVFGEIYPREIQQAATGHDENLRG